MILKVAVNIGLVDKDVYFSIIYWNQEKKLISNREINLKSLEIIRNRLKLGVDLFLNSLNQIKLIDFT